MDTMAWTKIVGAGCGSLLVFLLVQWAAEVIYHDHHNDHYEVAYLLEIDEEVVNEIKTDDEVPFLELVATADVSKGKKVFGKCKACHKLGDGENGTGPHLYRIIGRKIASATGFKYSGSLKSLEGAWTQDELNEFLTKPSNYAPGTAMSFAGLSKVDDRANLVAYLEENTN